MLKISFFILISVGISMGCYKSDPPTTTPTSVPTTTPTTTTTDSCNGYFWSNGRFKRCTFTPTTIETTTTTTTTTEKECPLNSILLGNGECLDISTCGGYGRRYKRCTVTTTPNVFYQIMTNELVVVNAIAKFSKYGKIFINFNIASL
jgi:hypothetical protein